MSHNILSLFEERFDTRILLGGCLLNIDGDTVNCVLERNSTNLRSPTYTVREKETGRELCTFRPYHLNGGPFWYQIEGVSASGGDATLVVPEHGLLSADEQDEDFDACEPLAA